MIAENKKAWTIENNVCSECPEMEKTEVKVILTEKAERQINALLNAYKNNEWSAGLKGRKKDNTYYIDEIVITEQEVSGSFVELTTEGNIQLSKIKGIIGWIHSHNSMGSFQSGTDEDTATIFDLAITVNNSRDYFVRAKKRLSCNRLALAEVDFEKESDKFEDNEFLETVKPLIKERPATYIYNNGWEETREDDGFSAYDSDKCVSCMQKLSRRTGKREYCELCNRPAHKFCLFDGLCQECYAEENHNYY
jgi:hypothetical protein